MAWFESRMWLLISLLSTLALLGLPDQLSDEKSHCTADSCDSDEALRFIDGTDEEDRESGVHLAYSCASPNFVPEEETPVIFLHGMGDSRHAWNGMYQNIPILTHRKACVYDARNHGDSGWNDTLNVDVLAEDLGHFIDKLKIERATLVGHSMGGLTVMKFALNNPSKVDRLLIEDISVAGIPKPAMQFITSMVGIMGKSISLVPKSADEETAKKIIVDYFKEVINQAPPENLLNRFPVHQKDGVWQWKCNFEAIQKALAEHDKTLALNPQGQFDGKALFIYGKLSFFGVGDHEEDIRKHFPKAEFFGVEGAGHDVHSEHREFQTQLIKFLE